MTISVVMIVKNEEKMLARCLESVKEADSIVIVDTGSEDKTVEIAKKYTDKIFHFKWCDSFCKARNFAKSKATGDWILSIDADEYLNNSFEEVRKVVENTDKDLLNVDVTSEKGSTHDFPRLFKNTKDIEWRGDIHNYLNKHPTQHSGLEIIYGYSPAHKADPDRALRILTKTVKENKDCVREKYYLAREYFYRRKWQECIDKVDAYLKVATWLAEKNEANLMKAKCYSKLGKYDKACDCAWEALKYNTNFKEAIEFIAQHMDPINKQRWQTFANGATNSGVLFVRDTHLPMDLLKAHLKVIKGLLEGYKKVDILEWGSGNSTKYFPEYLQSKGIEYTWTALEHNKDWYERVNSWNVPNVNLILADKDSKKYLKPSGKYDVIYVDGRNRVKCLQYAKKILKKGGVVLLHDAQREKYKEGFDGYKVELLDGTPAIAVLHPVL